ncbi:MAG: SAM-dependent chlorinase/fluorinase [Lamprobacter sp.]|uniref:SAM hydrolase/SAM-dependent halogenase family protein n=1 Tax=Lamprobacter sp. TaxID=3100796 RepID=UPI002B25907F|nr:SAM-dependent chlorinase/fluorinase [Lamprobacter sp.]MEA3641583.1 SAM-dependent chlorinase/fluorinase [Lamprobacter sp.]
MAQPCARIALLSDFGDGPYVGQMRLRLTQLAPHIPAVTLISDLPSYRPDLAAYLLPGLQSGMPSETLYCCVVDPGVGTSREVIIARCGADWWLGPDNGLLMPLLQHQVDLDVYRLRWRPQQLSASFHGRDLFVPVAARLVKGELPESEPIALAQLVGADWSEERACVCYIDAFGNLMTGLQAEGLSAGTELLAAGRQLKAARTFADVAVGEAFWYRNAFGLVELAVNQGRADATLGLGLGAPIALRQGGSRP